MQWGLDRERARCAKMGEPAPLGLPEWAENIALQGEEDDLFRRQTL